jgi:hypothetical protein
VSLSAIIQIYMAVWEGGTLPITLGVDELLEVVIENKIL